MILMTFYIQGSHLLGHTVIVKTKNKEKIKISNNETVDTCLHQFVLIQNSFYFGNVVMLMKIIFGKFME